MAGGREHVHGAGPDSPVAKSGKALDVPAQRGRVAGDIHHPAGPHARHGGHYLLAQALAGRVHGDHVRTQSLPLQLGRDVGGVSTEKFRVVDVVAHGVFPCVVNGRRHDLRTQHPGGAARHAKGDGAGAAVEVQHRLLTRQARKLQCLMIQHLRLVPVHLIKRRHGELELQAAQGVHEEVLAPEGAVAVPQDHVAPAGVGVEHHTHGARRSGADIGGQLRLPGHLAAVGHHAAKALPRPVHPHIDVAHQALAGGLIVGADLIAAHPLPHRLCGLVRHLRLDEAALDRHHLMAAGAVKAHGTVSPHGVLTLVAVAERVSGPQDLLHLQVRAAQTLQGVLHPLALGPQLLRVGQVLEIAPAANAEVGALRLRALRRGFVDPHQLSHCRGLHDPGDLQIHRLAPDGARHEHHRSVQPHDAQALAGVALHRAGVHAARFQLLHVSLLLKRTAVLVHNGALLVSLFRQAVPGSALPPGSSFLLLVFSLHC